MKKLFIIALTTIVAAAFAIPASAVEHEFGGYWRTRMYSTVDFDGTESGTNSLVDTRTRLYYTAKLSDNLKFVNKFEFDTDWGDDTTGDIGADGKGAFEIKNSYADFNLGPANVKMGVQAAVIGRGFIFDDDFSGITATMKAGAHSCSAIWMKTEETFAGAAAERDYYAIMANLNLGDTLTIVPYFLLDKEEGTETALYFIGADVDAKMGDASAWATLIAEAGEAGGVDNGGFLAAFGGSVSIAHAEFLYSSGQDPDETDDTAFTGTGGTCYYWSEIMGAGIFDDEVSGNSPGTGVSNLMAANIGATMKPMEKLTVSADLWYATLVEDDANGENELGVEIDLKATYKLLDNLNLDVVAAYLVAGDATGEEDPIEVGTRLSMSF